MNPLAQFIATFIATFIARLLVATTVLWFFWNSWLVHQIWPNWPGSHELSWLQSLSALLLLQYLRSSPNADAVSAINTMTDEIKKTAAKL